MANNNQGCNCADESANEVDSTPLATGETKANSLVDSTEVVDPPNATSEDEDSNSDPSDSEDSDDSDSTDIDADALLDAKNQVYW